MATSVIKDKETGNLRLPHHLDEKTGMYRGKQIFTPKVKASRVSAIKGPSTAPEAHAEHDHVHDHANAEAKASKGVKGKVAVAGRPKARSGFGGGA